MNKRLTVYVASSWKNREEVRRIADLIRDAGMMAYDFTNPTYRKTPEIPPERFPEQFDPDQHDYGTYLNRPEWRGAVEENRRALIECDGVVLLLPCGIDATADWAYAISRGKPSVVVGHPKKGERSPVHLWADLIVPTAEEAIDFLKAMLESKFRRKRER